MVFFIIKHSFRFQVSTALSSPITSVLKKQRARMTFCSTRKNLNPWPVNSVPFEYQMPWLFEQRHPDTQCKICVWIELITSFSFIVKNKKKSQSPVSTNLHRCRLQHNYHGCSGHKRSGIPNGRAWPIELNRLNRRPGKTKNNGSFFRICNQNNRFRLCDSDCDWDCRRVHLIAVRDFPNSNTSLVFSYKSVFVLFYQSTIDAIKQIKNPSFEHWCSSSIEGVTWQIVDGSNSDFTTYFSGRQKRNG